MNVFQKESFAYNEGHFAELQWQWTDNGIRVSLSVRGQAADQRQLHLRITVNLETRVITVYYRIECHGKTYNHDSLLRGFYDMLFVELQGVDPERCDWQAQKE